MQKHHRKLNKQHRVGILKLTQFSSKLWNYFGLDIISPGRVFSGGNMLNFVAAYRNLFYYEDTDELNREFSIAFEGRPSNGDSIIERYIMLQIFAKNSQYLNSEDNEKYKFSDKMESMWQLVADIPDKLTIKRDPIIRQNLIDKWVALSLKPRMILWRPSHYHKYPTQVKQEIFAFLCIVTHHTPLNQDCFHEIVARLLK